MDGIIIIKNDIAKLKLTSCDWYLNFAIYSIMDADGWRDLDNPAKYWYTNPISLEEFIQRYTRSTLNLAIDDKYLNVFEWPN